MKIIIAIMLSAAFFLAPCASSFAESVTRTTVLSRPIIPVGLPKTGQTISYPNGNTADRDDGHYQKGYSGIRYTDNGDGTVTDNASGLMWVKDPSQIDGVWGAPGSPVTMSWSDAIINCEALTYAGKPDWRLPNIKELMSIIDCSKTGPVINTTYFPNTASDFYWSSTTDNGNITLAWNVAFNSGYINNYIAKSGLAYVRPVRGGR